jgi:hypothetical protein
MHRGAIENQVQLLTNVYNRFVYVQCRISTQRGRPLTALPGRRRDGERELRTRNLVVTYTVIITNCYNIVYQCVVFYRGRNKFERRAVSSTACVYNDN